MRNANWLLVVGSAVGLVMGCTVKSTTIDGTGGSSASNGSGPTTSGNGSGGDDTTTTTASNGQGGGDGGYGGTYSNGNGQTVGAGGAPVSCESDPNDACDTCFKNSCCNEIEACDDGCKAKYVEYLDCIAPDGVPTGYNKNYCKASVGATGAAAALIDCSASNCYTASACGAPNKDTWNDFAADFMERYCVGCHFDGYGEEGHLGSKDTRDYSTDETWDDTSLWPEQPFGNPNWKALLSLDNVKLDGDMIWCGVSEVLPEECAEKFPGKFPNAKRFPPQGALVNGLECWWIENGESEPCPQPTSFERARMMNFIFDDFPVQ